MFVDLNRYNLFELLKIVLHQFQNVRYNIDDVFRFDDQKTFSYKFVKNFVKIDDHTKIEIFVDEK